MIFMTRKILERLIDEKVHKALTEYRLNGGGRAPEYTISRVFHERGEYTTIEEVERLPPGAFRVSYLVKESLPPMSLTELLNRIIEAAGIKLSVKPAVPAQIVAECQKVKK